MQQLSKYSVEYNGEKYTLHTEDIAYIDEEYVVLKKDLPIMGNLNMAGDLIKIALPHLQEGLEIVLHKEQQIEVMDYIIQDLQQVKDNIINKK